MRRKHRPGHIREFDISVACEYGIDAAAIVGEIERWTEWFPEDKNRNFIRVKGDYVWLKRSCKDMQGLMPWMSVSTMEREMKVLVQGGVLLEGDAEEFGEDHKLWHAVDFRAIDRIDVPDDHVNAMSAMYKASIES